MHDLNVLDVFLKKYVQYTCGNGFRSGYIRCRPLILINSPAPASGRKQALTDEIWGSAFEKLLQMDTADSKIQEFAPE